MKSPIEFRSFHDVTQDADAGGFTGYASHFMSVDSYLTAFRHGAYKKSIAERGDRIPVLYSHNPDWNIGVPDVLREDDRGLYSEARIFDDGAEGTTALRRLRQGARFGLSVGFRTIRDRAAREDDALDLNGTGATTRDVRIIEEVKLMEFSLVSFPANESATLTSVRSDMEMETLSSTLEALRAGRLDDAQRALLAEIVAAWQAAPELHPQSPRTEAEARADREAALNLMLADIGLTVGDILNAA